MSEGVFELLGSAVAHIGEDAEGRHIDKIPVIEAAHITGAGRALHCGKGGLLQPAGKSQIPREVIGGAGGKIAQHRRSLQGEKTGYRLAEGAVASAADHPVVPPALPGSHAGGVFLALGGPDRHQIVRFGEDIHNVGQVVFDDPLARLGIVDEEQPFHSDSSGFLVFLPPGQRIMDIYNYTSFPGKAKPQFSKGEKKDSRPCISGRTTVNY